MFCWWYGSGMMEDVVVSVDCFGMVIFGSWFVVVMLFFLFLLSSILEIFDVDMFYDWESYFMGFSGVCGGGIDGIVLLVFLVISFKFIMKVLVVFFVF